MLPEKRMPQYTTPFRFQDPSFFPFLNTHTEDFSVHSHLRRTPLASDVISDDKCDESDCDQRVKTETASPTFSSVIRSNYAFQYSQLGLSSTDSTLLDFCKSHHHANMTRANIQKTSMACARPVAFWMDMITATNM